MNESYEQYLSIEKLGGVAAAKAVRYYLAERCDDPTLDDVRADLTATANRPDDLNAAIADLSTHPETLEDAAKALLAWAWASGDAERVMRAVDASQQKLPALEIILLANFVMFGLHLYVTGGRVSRTITFKDDKGNTVKIEEKFAKPPLAKLISSLKPGESDDS